MAKPMEKKGDRGLTPKQEAFALGYFETANAAEAYRRAYEVAPNARDEWIYVEASQMLDHPKVAARLQELSDQAAQLSIYTRHKAMEELEDARSGAMTEAQISAAVSAINAKIKLSGLDRPQRLDLSSSDGTMSPAGGLDLSRLTDEELDTLERLTDKARPSEGEGEA